MSYFIVACLKLKSWLKLKSKKLQTGAWNTNYSPPGYFSINFLLFLLSYIQKNQKITSLSSALALSMYFNFKILRLHLPPPTYSLHVATG